MNPRIEEQKIITITYELREGGRDGALLERMDARYPFIFLFGRGKLLKSFEENLRGLKMDDSFDFTLSVEEGYGKTNPLNILKIKLEDFKRSSNTPDDYIRVGNLVKVTDDGGLRHNGKILEIAADYVKIDFNHAMADKSLHFKGNVLHIREATIDELIRGHYIEKDGVRRF